MPKKFEYFLLHLVILFSIRFYDAKICNNDFFKYLQLALFTLITILSFPKLRLRAIGFELPVFLIVASALISIPVSYFTWEQSITDSIIALFPFLLWSYFFYLKDKALNISKIEKIVVFYGYLYIVLYLFQFFNSGTVYFGWNEEFGEGRGITRIIFPGGGVFFLSVFIALSKLNSGEGKRWSWIFLIVAGVIITVMQVTRQLIAGLLIVYVIHFMRQYGFFTKLLVMLAGIFVVFYISSTDNAIIRGLKTDMERDAELGKDYIRIQSGLYYLNDFSPTFINRILGNGSPRFGVGKYGKEVEYLEKKEGLYMVDVGLIGLYAMYGVFVIVGYLILWYKGFKYKLNERFSYLKYYLLFLFITSISSDYTFQNTYLIANIICIAIFHLLVVGYRKVPDAILS